MMNCRGTNMEVILASPQCSLLGLLQLWHFIRHQSSFYLKTGTSKNKRPTVTSTMNLQFLKWVTLKKIVRQQHLLIFYKFPAHPHCFIKLLGMIRQLDKFGQSYTGNYIISVISKNIQKWNVKVDPPNKCQTMLVYHGLARGI